MKYLVTGGVGFIGSHLCEHLVRAGHTVRALDDLSTGYLANVRSLAGHERFEFTVGSVLDREALEAQVAACDGIFHLAAVVGMRRVLARPIETLLTNVEGTKNVLDLACRHGRKVFVASSSEVYGRAMEGRPRGYRLCEEDAELVRRPAPLRRWAYACSKAAGEAIARARHRACGLPVVVGRFFNIAGPRQSGRYGMVIPTFVRHALQGKALRVFGSGEQTRSFTHVADAIRAACALMEAPAAAGRVFNIGAGGETSINELAARVRRLIPSSAGVVRVPYEKVYGCGFEDVQRRVPSLSRLQAVTGFEARHDVDDILRAVTAFLRQRGQIQASEALPPSFHQCLRTVGAGLQEGADG